MSRQRKNREDKGQPVWDVLRGVSASVGACNRILAPLTPYLRDTTILDKIPDRQRFMRLVQNLDRDVRQMTQRFEAIYAQHSHRQGQTIDPNDVVLAIELQEQYVEWASQFDDVIVPVFMEIVEILKGIGEGQELHAPSASAAVAQHN